MCMLDKSFHDMCENMWNWSRRLIAKKTPSFQFIPLIYPFSACSYLVPHRSTYSSSAQDKYYPNTNIGICFFCLSKKIKTPEPKQKEANAFLLGICPKSTCRDDSSREYSAHSLLVRAKTVRRREREGVKGVCTCVRQDEWANIKVASEKRKRKKENVQMEKDEEAYTATQSDAKWYTTPSVQKRPLYMYRIHIAQHVSPTCNQYSLYFVFSWHTSFASLPLLHCTYVYILLSTANNIYSDDSAGENYNIKRV